MPRWLALAVAVPVAAQLACQPVLFLLSPQLTPYTVPANLLAEPAAAAVSVLGLGVCLLGVLVPSLASVAAWVPWVPSAWIGAVARFFAGLPLAIVPLADSLLAASVAVAVLGAVVFCLVAARRHRVATRAVAGGCAVVVVVSVGLAAGGVIARDGAIPPGWLIAACDIGQGDAVVLRSAGSIALVDVGPEPEPLGECLAELGIERIDVLVLTHYDRDHVGGLDAVIGRVSTAVVGPPDGVADERLLDRLDEGGAQLVDGVRGLHGGLGALRWSVLWPQPHTRLRGNDASVTVLFTGPLSALFLGDLGESAQNAVLAAGPLERVDVVKVSHHGSADQSDRLYTRVSARLGLISVGADNGYGHPTDRLLSLLARTGTQAFRTDTLGLITVSVSPATASAASGAAPPTLSVWSEHRPP